VKFIDYAADTCFQYLPHKLGCAGCIWSFSFGLNEEFLRTF